MRGYCWRKKSHKGVCAFRHSTKHDSPTVCNRYKVRFTQVELPAIAETRKEA